MIEAVYLERGAWLLALVPMALLLRRLRTRARPEHGWVGLVDSPLLEALSVETGGVRRLTAWRVFAAGMVLAVVALSGPVLVTSAGELRLGPWITAGLLPLGALAFRRGWLAPGAQRVR